MNLNLSLTTNGVSVTAGSGLGLRPVPGWGSICFFFFRECCLRVAGCRLPYAANENLNLSVDKIYFVTSDSFEGGQFTPSTQLLK